MSLSTALLNRSEHKCELCSSAESIRSYTVSPKSGNSDDDNIVICAYCQNQIDQEENLDVDHWRCLNDSMWNATPAVQVMAYRLLKRLESHAWAESALGMIYLDENTLEWAESSANQKVIHKDSNGNVLSNGDTVTLIKDLPVKGSSLVAKRGVAVRRIRLVPDNSEHIEGKVEGQQIVILTKFVKKS